MHYRFAICFGCLIAWGAILAQPVQVEASCGDYLAGADDMPDAHPQENAPLHDDVPCNGPSCRSNDGNLPTPTAPDRLVRLNVEQWAIWASVLQGKSRTRGWLVLQSFLALPERVPGTVERPPRAAC